MTSSLDLNLLPMARKNGQDLPELPDLYAVMPPRRPARGRETDGLIIYLGLIGNAPLSPEQHTHLLERLAQKYYKTTGSVTAAMRAVAESLNLYLLDRNLRSTSGGRQGIGLLVLGVLRADTFYMAQCGPVYAILINPNETHALHDLQSAGRGLGLSRTTPVRFVQARLEDGDCLVLASQPAPGWTVAALRHPQRQGMDGMRRQLLDYAVSEMNAVLIQAQSGTGRLRLLRRKPGVPDMAHPLEEVLEDQALPEADRVEMAEAASEPIQAPGSPSPAVQRHSIQPPARPVETVPSPSVQRAGLGQSLVSIPSVSTSRPRRPESPKSHPRRPVSQAMAGVRLFLGKIGQGLSRALGVMFSALARLLKNILPDEGTLHLPSSVMIFFALVVPLVLATVGGMVFFQRGRSQQYQFYYQDAVLLASQASSLTEPALQRNAWDRVLEQLAQAESYMVKDESRALRSQAQSILDGLDGVQRLDFQTAVIGGLDEAVHVTRIAATDIHLYMLNASQGSVLHGVLTPRGYEIDPNFQCGPSYGPVTVGPLVDIVELPVGAVVEDAVLLGMDAAGNLLYCTLFGQPLASTLAQPATGLSEPTALTIDQGNLYVLDPKVNAVWIYEGMDTSQPPRLFFGNEVPLMQDVIDLAVYNDQLYLLHSDGHLTQCIYSRLEESPTSCNDPYPYTDNRPGRQNGAVIPDSLFNQVSYVSFPDRSMYLLDPQHQAIFYFSVLFNFQIQYRAVRDLPQGQATAFAVSPDRLIFLAIGNSIYYAALP
jgi:hypothetical protein